MGGAVVGAAVLGAAVSDAVVGAAVVGTAVVGARFPISSLFVEAWFPISTQKSVVLWLRTSNRLRVCF